MDRKQTKKYLILVEGQDEELYFKRLEQFINLCEDVKYKVSINIKVIRNNFSSFIKKNSSISLNTVIYFVYDYEGNEEYFKKNVLSNIKSCRNIKKGMQFVLGYNNLSIELWMLLHKTMFKRSVIHIGDYLEFINRQFNEKIESINTFKQETDFKKCLSKITLDNVKKAVKRADKIMEDLKKDEQQMEYKGFRYYRKNPSLTTHEIVRIILSDCEIY